MTNATKSRQRSARTKQARRQAQQRAARQRVLWIAVAILAVALLIGQLRWGAPIVHYDWARQETETTVAAIRTAIDSAAPGADVYIENRPFAAIGGMLQRRLDLFPGWAGVFVIFFPENVVDGRRVRFISAPEVVAATHHGVRTATLLVTEKP